MIEIGLAHYLAIAAILFTLGIFGIFLTRKNVIIFLMSVEYWPSNPSGVFQKSWFDSCRRR